MKKLWKGNEAIAEAAVAAGCRYFFGYPITPQNEIPEYMSWRLFEVGGAFIQAESEVSAINMVYGAAGAGARAMTSSSSPGVSLKQEGISYIAGAELPCVIVNMMRSGPGLGGISPAQGDYFQATKGGGHGDYHCIVYAPSTVQEFVDITYNAFDVADKYRNPVMIIGDGMLGQMMETAEIPPMKDLSKLPDKDSWAACGHSDGKQRLINSIRIEPDDLEAFNHRLFEKYAVIAKNETKFEEYHNEDAEIVFVAYGSVARICKSAVLELRAQGVKAGLIRPITLYPFPTDVIAKTAGKKGVKKFITVEMSMGQMVEDVRLAVDGKKPVEFYGRCGGNIMMPADLVKYVKEGK
ncbi:MAG: 3-methyl-2-oxobutanoate dehydrogenase subunit VorB [Clostridiales bacterium]|nr:3-methyl-2-oxobutanoate dehydrogenase subunit VorB [Clostridiales bacterium]